MTLIGAGAGAGFGRAADAGLSDVELASWDGLVAWLDPKYLASITKVADPAITNGGYDSDTDWTKGTGWTIGSGIASHASGSTSTISQVKCTTGCRYTVRYTCLSASGTGVAGVAGGVIGSYSADTGSRSSEATATGTTIGVSGHSTCTGTIDDVSGVCHSLSAIAPRAGSLTSAFSQATATAQPWLDTTTGAIRFDATADFLSYSGSASDFTFLHYSATETGNRPLFHVVIVAYVSGVTVSKPILSSYTLAGTPGLYIYNTNPGRLEVTVRNDSASIAIVTSADNTLVSDTLAVIDIYSTGSTAGLYARVNGVAVTPDTTWGTPSSSAPNSINIAKAVTTYGDGARGDILFFDRNLTDAEMGRLLTKLATKWSIALP